MITPLVYFGHCIVRTSSIYDFWLLLWYIFDHCIVHTLSIYDFWLLLLVYFWSLYCPYFVYLRLMITPLVYFGHCIVRTSSIYDLWLLPWYSLVIVLSVLRLFTASDYFFGIFCPLYWPYVLSLRLLMTSLVYFGHYIIRTSSIYAFDNFFGIFWSLYCPYFVYLRLLITPLVYFGHCIVRTSSIYGLW